MRNVLTLSALVLTASLTLASAQTTVNSQSIVPTPVPAPVPAARLPSALAELVRAGGSITLTDAQGHAVATVSADGTVKVTNGMLLSNATSVSVKQGTTITSYPLAVRVNNSGQLFVTTTNAEGHTQVIPLVAAVNRAAESEESKKADGKKTADQKDQKDQDEHDGQKGDGQKDGAPAGQHGDSGEHGSEGHQPGRGNGHH